MVYRTFYILITSLLLTSCISTIKNEGISFNEEIVQELRSNNFSKNDIIHKLGAPSAQTHFGEEVWYYISLQTKSVAFFQPKIIKEEVLAISFTKNDSIKVIDTFNEEDMKQAAYVSDETPVYGTKVGKIHSFVKNIGRFNLPKQGPNTKRTGIPGM